MKKITATGAALAALSIAFAGVIGVAAQAPFGTTEHRAYGDALWESLREQKLVGDGAIMSMPYEGSDPHGMVLATLESEVEVNGDSGSVVVKRNYGGPQATIETVSNNPDEYLMATTVMFKREGFDPENQNWFWAKYMPDASYDTAPNGAALVGTPTGCVSCHAEAPGGDMVFLNDRY
ncbi:MAG: cytochrome P460 family protein [Pseudohongiellaceae bacterium]